MVAAAPHPTVTDLRQQDAATGARLIARLLRTAETASLLQQAVAAAAGASFAPKVVPLCVTGRILVLALAGGQAIIMMPLGSGPLPLVECP